MAHERSLDAGLAAAFVADHLDARVVEHPDTHVLEEVTARPQSGAGSSSTVVTLTAPVSLEP
ncbi:hypothetical protein P9209_09010 [Prescottella defluvii]|nr:hypothetical protein P9209_09010 [Prescottella defluvii]